MGGFDRLSSEARLKICAPGNPPPWVFTVFNRVCSSGVAVPTRRICPHAYAREWLMKTVADRIKVGVRMLLFVAASAWLALPTFPVHASEFAPFTRVLIEGPYPTSIDAPPGGTALGDIDGDGYPDIAAASG